MIRIAITGCLGVCLCCWDNNFSRKNAHSKTILCNKNFEILEFFYGNPKL